jgi:hypothetical protein
MMGRLHHDQGPLFYSFRLDEAVPDDHLVREIAGVLDLTWVHAELAPFYSKTGRPSIAAVLFSHAAIAGSDQIAADYAIVPDPTITPGRARTEDAQEICANGTKALRHWSRDRDGRILRAYGLARGPHPDFEVDHLISLGIGGADTDNNLWPEPRRSLEPVWNAERKIGWSSGFAISSARWSDRRWRGATRHC